MPGLVASMAPGTDATDAGNGPLAAVLGVGGVFNVGAGRPTGVRSSTGAGAREVAQPATTQASTSAMARGNAPRVRTACDGARCCTPRAGRLAIESYALVEVNRRRILEGQSEPARDRAVCSLQVPCRPRPTPEPHRCAPARS